MAHPGLPFPCRDDPAILGWALANEPRCAGDTSCARVALWAHHAATFLKELDPHHLVTLVRSPRGWLCVLAWVRVFASEIGSRQQPHTRPKHQPAWRQTSRKGALPMPATGNAGQPAAGQSQKGPPRTAPAPSAGLRGLPGPLHPRRLPCQPLRLRRQRLRLCLRLRLPSHRLCLLPPVPRPLAAAGRRAGTWHTVPARRVCHAPAAPAWRIAARCSTFHTKVLPELSCPCRSSCALRWAGWTATWS